MQPRSALHIGLLILVLANMVPASESGQSWLILTMAVAAAGASLFAYRKTGQPTVPRWVVYTGAIVATAYIIYDVSAPHEEQTVYILDLADFLVFLCICKFFDLCTSRDMGLVVLMSFLLLIIGAFVSGSLLFGLTLLVDVSLGVGWWLAYQTKCRQDAVSAARRDGRFAAIMPTAAVSTISTTPAISTISMPLVRSTPPSSSTPSTSQTPSKPAMPSMTSPGAENGNDRPAGSSRAGRVRARGAHARVTAIHAVGLSIIATIVFVLIPRDWEHGLLFGVRRAIPISVTGWADEVRLDDAPILEDPTPVIRARFTVDGKVVGGEDFKPYLRGRTFDRYYEGRWHRTPSIHPVVFAGRGLGMPGSLINSGRLLANERTIEQHIWLARSDNGVLFSMYPPLSFGSTDIEHVRQDRKDLALEIQTSHRGAAHYVVHSLAVSTPRTRRLEAQPLTPRDGPSAVPPRVAAFARELAAQYGDPTEPDSQPFIAQRVCDYLRSGEFAYTRQRGAASGGGDPIEDFLFENKRGHCEYFASAMVLLCQAVGIRARLVSGYYGGLYNEVGGFYQVRQKDAHAWVEVFLHDRGWIVFDPTPAAGESHALASAGLWSRIRLLIDSLQFKWSLSVVSFDVASRKSLTDQFRDWLGGLSLSADSPTSFWETCRSFLWGPELLPWWQRVVYWIFLGLCVILALLVLRLFWMVQRLLREHLPSRRGDGRRVHRRFEARFYDRLVRLLARKGHVRAPHLTPREFAASLADRYRDLADLPEFVVWFYEAQYAGRPPDRQRRSRLRDFMQRLGDEPAFGLH